MAITPQNDSLLAAAASSILGGKQLVSLSNAEEIRGSGIMYAGLIASYFPKANATKVANAISAGTPTINVFVNGIAFEVDEQKMVLYVVNTYDLSQLKNLYGDVQGAELPSGYFIVVAANDRVFADDTVGNLGMVAAPDVKNVATGKTIKEAVRVGDTVQGIMGADGGYKGKVKRLTKDSRGKLQVVFVDDKGVERETPEFNVKKISEASEGDLDRAVKLYKDVTVKHDPKTHSTKVAFVGKSGTNHQFEITASGDLEWQTSGFQSTGAFKRLVKGDTALALSTLIDNLKTKAVRNVSEIAERTMSVTYAQAISALAGSAEDEDISVIKRYADCVSIIFRMTPKEVMKDLLPESDTHKG